jgi:hypothetical protein
MTDFNDPKQMRAYLSTHGWIEYEPGHWLLSGPIGRDGKPFNRKLNDRAVTEIRFARSNGALLSELAQRYGVHVSHVSKICNGHRR